MRLKRRTIWTVTVVCLVPALAGIVWMVFGVFDPSQTEGPPKLAALMPFLPLLFLLAFLQRLHSTLEVDRDGELASRTVRRLLWCSVLLLVVGTLLAVASVLGMENR